MEEKDFKIWVFFSHSDAAATKVYTECKSLNNFERGNWFSGMVEDVICS